MRFADREAWLADDSAGPPTRYGNALEDYAAERRREIDPRAPARNYARCRLGAVSPGAAEPPHRGTL